MNKTKPARVRALCVWQIGASLTSLSRYGARTHTHTHLHRSRGMGGTGRCLGTCHRRNPAYVSGGHEYQPPSMGNPDTQHMKDRYHDAARATLPILEWVFTVEVVAWSVGCLHHVRTVFASRLHRVRSKKLIKMTTRIDMLWHIEIQKHINSDENTHPVHAQPWSRWRFPNNW